ncbi:MAG: L-idonate 5-dehydrogenase [Granulosicoccus sp.]
MKAIVIHGEKDLRIEERETSAPSAGEVQITVATGGVCGSDLHYYNHGGIGDHIRVREPLVLGHEVSGHVSAIGSGVTGLAEGDLVAVSPSRPCGACRFCFEGSHNHCLNMRFYGSAMPMPHIQGAFRQTLNARAEQCIKADGLTPGEAAMAEPLAVVLHATRNAGEMLGKRVLVTGCGPIGVLSIIAARRAGALEIVATDLSDNALAFARDAGVDLAINTMTDRDALQSYSADKGHFDVMFECSGAVVALSAGIGAMRPGGVIMQLGLSGDMSLPMMAITAKELQLRGSFRFHTEFEMAVRLMSQGLVNLKPLVTHTLPLEKAEEAFLIANDRSQAMKAQIDFTA